MYFDVQGRGAQDRRDLKRRKTLVEGDWFCHTAYVYAQKVRRDGHTCMGLSRWGPTTRGRSSSLSPGCGSPVFAWFLSSRDNGECSTTPFLRSRCARCSAHAAWKWALLTVKRRAREKLTRKLMQLGAEVL